MQQIPQEQIIKRFQLLPTVLQEAIFSDRTTDIVLKHCALREIPAKQTYLIGALLTQVLLGYLRPETFASEIQKETGIEELKAQHVAHDLDMEIFSEVRLELKKLYPPTMQTPTVQAQGFARAQAPAAPTAPVAKPKYVIPIPEKFQGKSFPGITPQTQSAPVTPAASAPIPTPVQPAPTPAPQPSAPVPEPKQPPAQQAPQPIPVAAPKPEPKPTAPPEPVTSPAPAQPAAEKKPEPIIPPKAVPAEVSSAPKLGEKPAQPAVKVAQTVEPGGVKMNPVVPLPTFIGSRFTAQAAENAEKPSEEKIKELAAKFAVSSTAQPKPQQKNPYQEKVDAAKKPGTVDLSKF